jgi:glutamyl-tRNA synthetase
MPIVGRFAPTPSGALHVGNLRTALAAWLSARSRGGSFLLRIEDVDAPRCRPEHEAQQLRDLETLGITWESKVLRQSGRSTIYREALETLHARGLLYPCHCTRKDLQLMASAPHLEDGLRPYPGRCREHPWSGFQAALRLRLPKGAVTWDDLLLGLQRDDPATFTGDPLLFRRDGLFAYHLAVVVDDGASGVTEVVRGADLRSVTATQIRLQEALDVPRPVYSHMGMVIGPDGTRLGKRDGALGLEALTARGVALPELVGWLGFTLGCLTQPEPCAAADLIRHFRWDQVPTGNVRIPDAWAI